MITKLFTLLLSFLLLLPSAIWAQKTKLADSAQPWSPATFKGLAWRSIGPALMSGRIADIAIHPTDDHTWYVAVGSGGVWKTVNAGITWTPIFDDQASYSIGCVTIDPNNPHTIWVGTGENVGGRHVGYGDGVYRSEDGGRTWTNMGLKTSEHISKIIVMPGHSNVVWVAAQGPLWKKGGERGLYKSIDGGKNWRRTLGDNQWIGVTDVALDPRNSKRVYAVTWQRHRNTAAYMGGGPGTAVYRSEDAGNSWKKLTEGLPKSNMGKIGFAISPQRPDVVYAAVELDRRKGGVYRSEDRGNSWKKMSDAVSGGTGPHYYQELYASPHQFDHIYLADVRMQISEDGGKTFRKMKEKHKHSDNHALAFRMSDPDYLLVGADGGLYESFDLGEHWRFIDNLPVTQFYKVAVDDSKPFYNVYGGTQDNSTQGGPSRTDKWQGIENADWRVILNWDGHQPATEPGNPNIVYGQRQQGTLARIDMITGEVVDIKPHAQEGEPYERFNWDAPILISPHQPSQLFFASQRLWRSDNRGDQWRAISEDLTRNEERIMLPIMGKVQSWDNSWDLLAMSNYNTITAIAESPKQRDLIYVGTDDGLIQVTENGGESWRKIEVSALPGVPKRSYVNDIKADLFDANTAYVALDYHKYGDLNPYLYMTTDRGKTWRSISSNLPKRTLVWRIVQDHINSNLLFVATEFAIYFSVDKGLKWTALESGLPTISFRDLAIQRRENDLVAASFGRGFYIFDDYSFLREISKEQMQKEASLFAIRKAWRYIPRSRLGFEDSKGAQGSSHYTAKNPLFGAVFTYYLRDSLSTTEERRRKKEKEQSGVATNVPFAGWQALDAEMREKKPIIWLVVKDEAGNVVRRLKGPVTAGFHRVAWDLRYPALEALRVKPKERSAYWSPPKGIMAPPGKYTVMLYKQSQQEIVAISSSVSFEVENLREGVLPQIAMDKIMTFWRKYEQTVGLASATQMALGNMLQKVEAIDKALQTSTSNVGLLDKRLQNLYKKLSALDVRLNGLSSKSAVGDDFMTPTIGERLFAVQRTLEYANYGPTVTAQEGLSIAIKQLAGIRKDLRNSDEEMGKLLADMQKEGSPWVEWSSIPAD